jgi:hypothetical protein
MPEAQTNLRQADAVIDLFDQAATAQRHSPVRDRSVIRLPARGKLLATGDLHDNPIHLQKIIRLARLDESPDHHVVLHEMIHGDRLINSMDYSYRMLARVAELILQYPGQVHTVLANHELAQLTGKGVSKGAGNSVELFNQGLEFIFGDDWDEVLAAVQRFIASMALALIAGGEFTARSTEDTEKESLDSSSVSSVNSVVNPLKGGGVLCAHSLPAPLMMQRFDVSVLSRELTAEDYIAPYGAAHLMVWGRAHTAAQVKELAAAWNVKLFVLGHEHVDVGIDLKHPGLIVLNSDHDAARVLPIDMADIPSGEEALMYAIPLAAL